MALSDDALRGVRHDHGGAITGSLLMRSKPGMARLVETHHQLSELRRLSAIGFA
jgi:fructose-1,6-bisphosphatase/sedoheptulose 1,7-bisphosphatase-like protein